MDVFQKKALKTMIACVPYPTGTVQVTLDAVGVPCYDIKEAVAWDNIPFTNELKSFRITSYNVCYTKLLRIKNTTYYNQFLIVYL